MASSGEQQEDLERGPSEGQPEMQEAPVHGPSDYYDILLVGRTGMGKSTTGNKLLGIDEATGERLIVLSESETEITPWNDADDLKYFATGDGSESVTDKCKLLSNERGVRVMDTLGFANSRLAEEYEGQECGEQICLRMLQETEKLNPTFSRVLYFLPCRGAPERAEGELQEEINAMYEYLGSDIFNIMVITATNKKGQKYQTKFDDDDIRMTKEVFTAAFEKVTGQRLRKCPPVLYLPFTETDVLTKIKAAEVIKDQPYTPKRKKTADEQSKCQHLFVPKYKLVTRIFGGFFHIGTLGIFLLLKQYYGVRTLPGFTNTDTICSHCQCSPGSNVCSRHGPQ